MKHGTLYQRHLKACPRDADGSYLPHRCRGSWAYNIEYGRDSRGKRLQTTKSGYPTKAEARAALDEVARTLMVDVSVHTMTVASYLEAWLLGKHRIKETTRAHYRDAVDNYLIPHLGAVRLIELQPHHLDRFYANITIGVSGRPLSNSSRRRVHAYLRSALNTAVKRRLIPYNPALHVELPPEDPSRANPWTADQCRAFLSAVVNDRLGIAYYLALVTGLRRGELAGLRWENVDLDGAALFVVEQLVSVRGRSSVSTPKSRKSKRVVPLDGATVYRLRRHREVQELERAAWGEAWHDTGYVLAREDGCRLRPEYLTKRFQRLTQGAGIPVIRLHDLRHTNASLALEAGVDIKVVSERLGHSSTAITADLYTHVNPTVGRAAADKIADVLGAGDAASDEASLHTARTVPSVSLAHEAPEGPEGGSDETTTEAPAPAFPLVRGRSEGTDTMRARRDSNP